MSKVVPFKKVTDEITIREDDVGVVTLRGAARLVGVSHEAISQAFKSVKQKPSKLIKALLEEGFAIADLAAMPKEGITDEAMLVISHYYGYQAGRHCKPKAKDFHQQLKKTGPRVTFRELKGVAPEKSQAVSIADEITIREDGVAIVSIRGAARLAGVSPSSIVNGLASVASTPNQMAQMIMGRGFDGVALLEQFSKQGIPDVALGAILKYYAYKAGQWCTEEAERACEQFDVIGIRSFCYSVKGMVEVKQPSSTSELPEPTLQLPSQSEPPKEVEIANPVEKARQVQVVVADLLEDVQLGQTPQQDKALKAQIAVSAIQVHCPELADALSPVKDMLATTVKPESDATCFTPTALGRRLDMSARAVNNQLKEMGLQVKNPSPIKGDSTWLPTETGKSYSTMEVGDQRRLNWSERVLELFNQTPKLFKGEAVA